MKTSRLFLALSMLLVLMAAPAWGSGDGPVLPDILASLDRADVSLLDDRAIADVRGQAQYVMVKVIGINTFDLSDGNFSWTFNPYNFRYGNYGGAGYGQVGQLPVDLMDFYFKLHDEASLTDPQLLFALGSLPKIRNNYWGYIYDPPTDNSSPDPAHFDYNVHVSRLSLLSAGSTGFFLSWRPMPLTEYARREAMLGMAILTLLQ